jgi:hypothetical protein
MPRSIVFLALCATIAHAQATRQYASHAIAPSGVSASEAAYRSSMGQMRDDLRNLIAAQDLYLSGNGVYAGDVTLLPSFHPMPGVEVRIQHAHNDGWAATETFSANGSPRSCTIWVGSVGSMERPATAVERKTYPEAEVACDGDGIKQREEWTSAAQSYMTFALRKLVRSEEKFFALNGRYTTNANALEPFLWDHGVTVTIVAATDGGWAAKASYALFPGKTCVLWRGTIDASALGRQADRDQIACDAL